MAAVKTNSIILQPSDLAQFAADELPIFGVAFAGLRRITAVEVRIDEGDWQLASLTPDASSLVWTHWAFDWQATPGRHTLRVRARDEDGFVQSSESAGLLSGAFPDGSDEIHRVIVNIVA
ncbi:MAG: hypothetical protein AB1449_07120 [Chloroflexota bacterium]